MTTGVDVEEIQTSRGERFLAAVLAAFLLMGGLWVYYEPLDRTDEVDPATQPFSVRGSAEDRRAIDARNRAQAALGRAQQAERAALQQLEVRREEYRTAIESGRPTAGKRQTYDRARSSYERARRETAGVRRVLASVTPAAREAERRLAGSQQRTAEEAQRERDARSRETFFLRLGWVLFCMVGAFQAFGRMRRQQSRYFVLGMALVGFAALQALVMATDYTTDYVEWDDLGPLVLSLAGIALTVAAFVALQRYLATRVPQRRVRRGECPFCGYPVRGGSHCEGCGRQVVAECAACSAPRRVGTAHCSVCGST
jgi:hypothetical protein